MVSDHINDSIDTDVNAYMTEYVSEYLFTDTMAVSFINSHFYKPYFYKQSLS